MLRRMPIPEPRNVEAEAKELRELREGLGFTREQIAAVLQESVSSFYRWETGKGLCPLSVLELLRCWTERERSKKRPKPKA